MPKTNEVQFNVKNVKFAVKNDLGAYGTPEDLAYAEAISLEPTYQSQHLYGDGLIIAEVTSDKGMTGSLTLVQPSDAYEIAMKRKRAVAGGTGDITQKDSVEHAIYFEVDSLQNGVNKTIKVWLLNVTSGKPAETFTQSKENPTLNNIEVPLIILGETLKNAAGTADEVDSNGNTVKVTRITAKPTDTDYATFGNAVPVPKVTA